MENPDPINPVQVDIALGSDAIREKPDMRGRLSGGWLGRVELVVVLCLIAGFTAILVAFVL